MLEEAAKTTVSEIDTNEDLDCWTGHEDQTLTLAFAATRPSETLSGERKSGAFGEAQSGISSPIDGWTTDDLERCLTAPSRDSLWKKVLGGDRVDPARRAVSLLWSEFITGIDISVDGTVADGVVNVMREGCFEGRVPFSMTRDRRGWVVTAFGLPDAGWTVRRTEDSGGWQAFRTGTVPGLPELSGESRYLVVQLGFGPSGLPSIGVNRSQVRLQDLPSVVAGQIVVLRVEEGVSGADYLDVIETIRRADPPILALFMRTRRMIDGCWCLLGGRSMVEGLLEDETLASPFVDVPRAMLPRRSVTLRVGRAGLSVRGPDSLWVSPEVSIRHRLGVMIDAVAREPELPVIIAVEPDARYTDIDIAFDIAVQSGTEYVFLPTDPGIGVVFEYREESGPCR